MRANLRWCPLLLPGRSVTFPKVSRFSLYLLTPAIPRADSNSEPDGFAGSACPGALAGHSLLREKASPTERERARAFLNRIPDFKRLFDPAAGSRHPHICSTTETSFGDNHCSPINLRIQSEFLTMLK